MTKIKKVMVTLGSFVMAVMTLSFGTVFAGESDYWKTKEYTDISEYRVENNYTPPALDGEDGQNYVFAGWFTDPSCTKETALKADVRSGHAYAKFVPKKVLGLKAQVSAELCDQDTSNDETGAIRFVTSVDSKAYAKIGFFIQVDGSNKVNEKSSYQVYETLRVKIGEGDSAQDTEHTPAMEFDPASKYFKTWTVTSVTPKDYGRKFTVTPYWKTLDGTIVRAETSIRTVNNGRNWNYVFVNNDTGNDKTGAGTKGSPYKTLEKTLNVMNQNMKFQIDNGLQVITPDMKGNVYVGSDLIIDKPMTISQDITLISEKPVTIARSDNMTAGNMFTVTGKALHIQGSPENRIILDGNNPVTTRAVKVQNGAACTMENVTVQNFVVNSGGGAVRVEGGSNVTVTNCNFIGNKDTATGGGAVYILSDGKMESINSTFQSNDSTVNGGAVHCKGTYNDTNSSYIGNHAKNGGAIFAIDDGNVTMNGTTAKLNGNQATEKGNAIDVQIREQNRNSKVSVAGYTFEGEVPQTVQVYGTLIFNNLPGAVLVPGPEGKVLVAGTDAVEATTLSPEEYPVGKQILRMAEATTEETFKTVCQDIQVEADMKGQIYSVDESGILHGNVARIGDTYYESLADAIAYANTNGGTGEAEDILIYVYHSSTLSERILIERNITIQNEPGKEVHIERSKDILMFQVNASTVKLTFGTNDETESGTLIVDAETAGVATKRAVDNYGVFVLGKNATIRHANGNMWGSALINRKTAELYGSFTDNTCTGPGGAILQNAGELTIFDGTYSNNQATRDANGTTKAGYGGVIYAYNGTINIRGGVFMNNSAKGVGGVLFAENNSQAKPTINISGGVFENNSAGDGASRALYVKGPTNINVIEGNENNASFAMENLKQSIYVYDTGTLNYSNIDDSLIQGKGTINKK